MEQVQFDETGDLGSMIKTREKKAGSLIPLLIKSGLAGLAKDEKQANIIMLMFSIICLLFMTFFIISTFWPNMLDFSKPTATGNTTSIPQKFSPNQNQEGTDATQNQ
jgi:hypothetical protein